MFYNLSAAGGNKVTKWVLFGSIMGVLFGPIRPPLALSGALLALSGTTLRAAGGKQATKRVSVERFDLLILWADQTAWLGKQRLQHQQGRRRVGPFKGPIGASREDETF